MNARPILLLASLAVGATGCVAYAQPYQPDPGYQQGYDTGYQDTGYQDQGYQDPGYQDQGYQDPGYQGYQDQGYYQNDNRDPSSYDQEYDGQPVSVDFFYRQLSPYGQWIERPNYGWVWYPGHVPAGWRPYRYGRWVYTDYGWTWVSQEPFGWATYHYGRWTLDPEYGWVWVPGTEWGPAWVAWQQGSGYIGWAPLPPSVRFRVGFGLDFGGINLSVSLGPTWYSFVPERSFLAPSLASYVVPPARNVAIIRNTTNITNYRVENNRIVNQSVPVQRVEQVTGQRIPRFRVADASNPAQGRAPRIEGDQVTIFRPRVSTAKPVLPPPQAIAQRPASPLRTGGQPGVQPPDQPGNTARQRAPQPGTRQPYYGGPQTNRQPAGQQPGNAGQPAAQDRVLRRRMTPQEVQQQQQREQQDLARQQADEQRRLDQIHRQEQQQQQQRQQGRNNGADVQQQRRQQDEAQAQREQQQRERQQLNARQRREQQNVRGQDQGQQPPPRNGQAQQPPQNVRGQQQGQQQEGRQQQPARQNRNKDKNKSKDNQGQQNDQKPPQR